MKRKIIYYTGKPKYIENEKNISHTVYIGDYLGIRNCEAFANVTMYASKKARSGKHAGLHFGSCSYFLCVSYIEETKKLRIKRFLHFIFNSIFRKVKP